jgi:hypothetical protein
LLQLSKQSYERSVPVSHVSQVIGLVELERRIDGVFKAMYVTVCDEGASNSPAVSTPMIAPEAQPYGYCPKLFPYDSLINFPPYYGKPRTPTPWENGDCQPAPPPHVPNSLAQESLHRVMTQRHAILHMEAQRSEIMDVIASPPKQFTSPRSGRQEGMPSQTCIPSPQTFVIRHSAFPGYPSKSLSWFWCLSHLIYLSPMAHPNKVDSHMMRDQFCDAQPTPRASPLLIHISSGHGVFLIQSQSTAIRARYSLKLGVSLDMISHPSCRTYGTTD